MLIDIAEERFRREILGEGGPSADRRRDRRTRAGLRGHRPAQPSKLLRRRFTPPTVPAAGYRAGESWVRRR